MTSLCSTTFQLRGASPNLEEFYVQMVDYVVVVSILLIIVDLTRSLKPLCSESFCREADQEHRK